MNRAAALKCSQGRMTNCVICNKFKIVGIFKDKEFICADCDDVDWVYCEVCDEQPAWRNKGVYQKVLCSIACQDCFNENEKVQLCETCAKPVLSNSDVYHKVHDCIVCQDCFDENEKAHEPPEPDGDGSGSK